MNRLDLGFKLVCLFCIVSCVFAAEGVTHEALVGKLRRLKIHIPSCEVLQLIESPTLPVLYEVLAKTERDYGEKLKLLLEVNHFPELSFERNAGVQDFDFAAEPLGTGSYGRVLKASVKGNNGAKPYYAVKVLNLLESDSNVGHRCKYQGYYIARTEQMLSVLNMVMDDIDVPCRFPHRNIVQIYRVMFHNCRLLIFMEPLPLGTFYPSPFIKTYTISIVRAFLRQMLDLLSHLHSLNIMYRDFNLGNFLMAFDPETGKTIIKVIDWGLARTVDPKHPETGPAGIDEYHAPELGDGSPGSGGPQDLSVDIYGLGIILLLVSTDSLGCTLLQNGELPPYNAQNAYGLRPELYDLLRACLKVDPKARPTVAQLQCHPFVVVCEHHESKIIAPEYALAIAISTGKFENLEPFLKIAPLKVMDVDSPFKTPKTPILTPQTPILTAETPILSPVGDEPGSPSPSTSSSSSPFESPNSPFLGKPYRPRSKSRSKSRSKPLPSKILASVRRQLVY